MQDKKILIDLYNKAVKASLPKNFMHKYCKFKNNILTIKNKKYDLSIYENIYIFGSGKASYQMAQEMEKILQDKIKDGFIITKGKKSNLKYIKSCEGSHPVPTIKSLECTKQLIQMMNTCKQNDFYIYLLSGGSSSLLELLKESITLQEIQECTNLMLKNGLTIQQINTVRKHLSLIKGGKLADMIDATGIVLVISDVVGDDLHTIGSAPLYQDNTTCKDAKGILINANLFHLVPKNIQKILNDNIHIKVQPCKMTIIPHFILASNKLATKEAYKEALNYKLNPIIIKQPMNIDVFKMRDIIIQKLKIINNDCIIFGGECTVDVKGNGKGGRNQHLILLLLEYICQTDHTLACLSAGTDGIDGNSDAAGAVINYYDCTKTSRVDIQKYLNHFDSYHLLKQLNSLIITGDTGTNVIDILVILRNKKG